MSALSIVSVHVGLERIEALVRVEPRLASTASAPGLAERALAILPGLAKHSCDNGSARGIVAELAATETAHLLEHVAVELMALAGSPRTLRGETAWDFATDGRHVYRVRLAYDVDVVGLGALREAAVIVDWLLGASAERPDVAAAVARLRAAREGGG